MAHDFRKIYGYSIFDVGVSVPWTEALLHLECLKNNPESLVYVALSDGEVVRPWSWFEIELFDLLDNFRAANSKTRPKPVARPWKGLKKLSKGALPYEVGAAFFAKLGHKPTINSKK